MKPRILLSLAALVAVSAAGGYWLARSTNADGNDRAATKERRILYWVAPMDPSYRSDKPGKSPMGMDLIPVYEGEEPPDKTTVNINPAVVQNLGVRTAVAERVTLHRRIESVGMVTPDENLLSHLHVRAAGWIERLHVKASGERVAKGQLLLELYSPDLVDAQVQYLQALSIGQQTLVTAAEERLRALGMVSPQIRRLAKRRKPDEWVQIYAPQDGYLTMLNVAEGMYVTPQTTIMSIADLKRIWVLVDVFEDQAPWVRAGDAAEITLAYLPGRRFAGTVDYVYPTVDPKSRTVKVRLVFANPDEALKPEMYAFATLHTTPKTNALVIPREALIRTGRNQRVILALGNGRFRPAMVIPGLESGEKVEILQGLVEGERVVTSAQFLIDSEASLAGTILRMTPGRKVMQRQDGPDRKLIPAVPGSGKTDPADPADEEGER
ncbi:MAG: efflux RND transporter periplasmic adaptor subunit [Alphaproteobacteria bacterium]|nr:MAG: efflux RND transporter periplasmic adaptor subunit [Alphaproteobacteria bacterium]